MQLLRYAGAISPLLIVGLVWLGSFPLSNDARAYLFILAGLVAVVASIPVTAVALVKLYQGKDAAWVVTALLCSLPVFLLAAIGLMAQLTR